jgi:DNA-binding NarL/FixJ family response regulator
VKPGDAVTPQTIPGVMLTGVQKKTITDHVQLPRLYMAWITPPQLSPADAALAGASGKTRERSPLSQREREIVALVAQGYKNKEMAEKMFISEQTVKNHLHNIFDKLGVSDRLELALYAIHKGLHVGGER